jgi:hypothetical protein
MDRTATTLESVLKSEAASAAGCDCERVLSVPLSFCFAQEEMVEIVDIQKSILLVVN